MSRRVKLAIIIAVIFIVGSIVMVALNNRHFRVVKTVPSSSGPVSTSLTTFRVETNHDLDTTIDYMKQLDDPSKHVTATSIAGKDLYITTGEHTDGQIYTFTIKNVRAKNGESIPAVTFHYTAKYIPYDKLSKAEKDLLAQQQASETKADPILAHLPHSTLDYKLDAQFSEPEAGNTRKFILVAELYLTDADMNIGEAQATEAYKKEVNDYITSLGLKPENYTIQYQIIKP